LSRFSPCPSSGEYPDGDPHGEFNPNSYFCAAGHASWRLQRRSEHLSAGWHQPQRDLAR
jgi:hypothetical protein